MKKINVIDLDKTLIPFDSFRIYVFRFMNISNFIYVFYIILLRKFRLITLKKFKSLIIYRYRKLKNYEEKMRNYAKFVIKRIDREVLSIIYKHTDANTINVIISASPIDYVRDICKILGWECIASNLDQNDFIHIYGKKKIEFLLEQYSPDIYCYNFSISDHDSDLELLTLFNYSYLIRKGKLEII